MQQKLEHSCHEIRSAGAKRDEQRIATRRGLRINPFLTQLQTQNFLKFTKGGVVYEAKCLTFWARDVFLITIISIYLHTYIYIYTWLHVYICLCVISTVVYKVFPLNNLSPTFRTLRKKHKVWLQKHERHHDEGAQPFIRWIRGGMWHVWHLWEIMTLREL